MSTLYIFVTTNRPDQYLNSIVFSILERRVSRIVFVQIKRSDIEKVSTNILRQNVIDLIRNLSSGKYKYYTGINEGTIVDLSSQYSSQELAEIQAKYQQCLSDNLEWEIKRFSYTEMRKYIVELNKEDKCSLFDVTPVSKLYIGDIFACCLIENIQELYTFNLKIEPNFSEPWKTLVHHLEKDKDYEYVNLVETPIFRGSTKSILIRTVPLLISIIGTLIFVSLTLAATFLLGTNASVTLFINTVGVALGIVSFFIIYFPIGGK
ncbi:MAG TPA: hypothetical protein V6D31_02605 [Candidatus Sericytochromatia bacterium]